MNRGSTCLVEYPFTDGTGAKVRPVLVVSRDEFNRGDDVIIVPITSRPDPSDPYSVFIHDDSPCFAKTGLRCASAVKWDKPLAIHKSLLHRRLGRLDEPLFSEVIESLIGLFKKADKA